MHKLQLCLIVGVLSILAAGCDISPKQKRHGCEVRTLPFIEAKEHPSETKEQIAADSELGGISTQCHFAPISPPSCGLPIKVSQRKTRDDLRPCIFISSGKGIILVNNEYGMLSCAELKHAPQFGVIDVYLPGPPKELENQLMPLILNQPIDQHTVAKVEKAITAFYENYGYYFVDVSVPRQNTDSGYLQIVVKQTR